MQSILFAPTVSERDALIATLWGAGTLGIVEEGDQLRAFFSDDCRFDSLQVYNKFAIEWRREPETADYATGADWEPFLVGESFFIAPANAQLKCPPDRHRLNIDSETAFGTGRHETTQLMMEAMERYLRPEYAVLDVGCGSGILSAAAAALGVGRVFACDIHWDALRTARKQIAAPLFAGAPDAVAASSMDAALVNISARVIDHLACEIERVVKPGGLLLLSGFIDARTPEAFSPEEVLRKGEWQCWVTRPSGRHAGGPVQPFSEQWWM